MAKETFNLLKFLGGFTKLINGAKAIVFGAWLIFFLIIGYTFWRAYFKKPLPTTVQNAEHIDAPNYYLQPRAFGCARIMLPNKK